ncbi:LysR family transcriptional regulator [Hydrogenophaga sp. PAMC20947]|uniref:LysR family transcriptional regulator n=1 Tax=Hydrogenophaga sp. PAMC20947 TaxID=2565558 RepID=UPI00109DDE14|nr:LysR family transcriptional regulator [Hydrogenophaga sp. PAMC20947]QCB44858.1 LysR family transcriptional regulator [Hydrogenophaga sp. PAMC20947]
MHPDALNEALGHTSSDKRLEVLRRVAQSGSISQAARETGVSYKAAWQAIDTLTTLSGAELVERTVGGAGGGGARITPDGLQLLALADELAQARRHVLAQFSGHPGLAGGLGLRTSMRNQLPCTILAGIEQADAGLLVTVRLRTAGGFHLSASVTRESSDLLGLHAGLSVLVMCKATAVAVHPAVHDALPTAVNEMCSLPGRVQRCSSGARRQEVSLALDGGGSWVGFTEQGLSLQVGDAACAWMAASALVIGLS